MEPNTVRVYHFVGDKFGRENIKKRRLKVAFPDRVNDLFEFMPFAFAESPNGDSLRCSWQVAIKRWAMEQGFVSFTTSWNVPTMWAHYAENHAGIALGFDIATGNQNGKILVKVEYANTPIKLDHRVSSDPEYNSIMVDIAQKTKSSHWKYEAEWRAWISLSKEEIRQKSIDPKGLFFVPFGEHLVLKEVIFGHRSTLTQVGVESILLPSDEVKFTTARPSFQKFEMIARKQ